MDMNRALAERLEQIARLMDLVGEDSFRASAHSRAARSIESLTEDCSTLDREALLKIQGIGPKIADKIIEFCRTGQILEHQELLKQVPAGLLALLNVPGLGPKTIRVLWQQGGVTDLAGLKRIIDDGSILRLPRMGEKAVEKIKASLAFAAAGGQRLALGVAVPIAELFVAQVAKAAGVKHAAYAGSLRRGRDTIGDIDILVAADKPGPAHEAFRAMPQVREVIAAGESKSSVRVVAGSALGRWTAEGVEEEAHAGPTVQADLRVVPPASWGAALMYFTGSKEHNVRLRERALKMGMTLNEYGLFPEDDKDTPPQSRGVKPIAARTEEDIYAALKLPYLPPEIREDRGEFDVAQTPELVTVEDIKAELHAHTTASDGGMSMEELVRRAKERGFHTIAVTDHSKSSAVANGLSVDRLLAQIEEVHKLNEKGKGIRVLAGSEVDILADGSLDYPDKVLKQLDIVVASPHVALSQNPEVATRRLLAAIKNPYVRILGHPTGRLINRRPGLSPDLAQLIAAAKERNVALEINAHWMRLDLRDVHVRAAVQAGCNVAIDCDVHAPEDFDNLRFGVITGRRGWLTRDLCINAWSAKKLHDWLARKGR